MLCLTVACNVYAKSSQYYPTPSTVSAELQRYIKPQYLCWFWNAHPKNNQEWNELVTKLANDNKPHVSALLKKLNVKSELSQIGGINVYILTPNIIDVQHKNRVLLHIHGGGYVFNPAEVGTYEGIIMAALGKIKVISVDYRMAPKYPYPAALDDVFTVYKTLLQTYDPKSIGVFGSSTGGGLTLALTLKAKDTGLPLPAAIAPASPWSDLAKIGDSYFTNDGVDNVLVSYDGWLKDAVKAYANGFDLKEPYLSPIYGDVTNFPPVFLTSGTRDLFLSNTVRMQQKLLTSNVPTELLVIEGMSHCQFMMDPDVPESRLHFEQVIKFFDKYFK